MKKLRFIVFLMTGASLTVACNKGVVDRTDSNADSIVMSLECSPPTPIPDLQGLRRPGKWLTNYLLADLGEGWKVRHEFFMLDHNFLVVLGYQKTRASAAARTAQILGSRKWVDCKGAPGVVGVKIIGGYRVVARTLKPELFFPGGRNDSVELHFTLQDYQIELGGSASLPPGPR